MPNDEKSNTAEGSTVVSVILWIIVFAKTSESAFDTLGNSTYYKLAELVTYGTIAVISTCALCCIMVAIGSMIEEYVCGRWMIAAGGLTGSITALGMIVIWISQLVYACIIMHDDVEHNFMGYKSFWNQGALHWENFHPNATAPHPSVMPAPAMNEPSAHWPYEMADVLVRITWGSIMMVLFVIAAGGVCGGGAWIGAKICGK